MITLTSEGAVATDQNGGTLATIDYFGRGVDAAATLTGLFGFEPVVEVVAPVATDFGFQGTLYDWEGFRLYWQYGYEDDPQSGIGSRPFQPPTSFTSTVAAVRDVAIVATDGAAVGDGQGDLSALYPDQTRSYTDPNGVVVESAFIDCLVLPPNGGGPDEPEGDPMNCVGLRAEPSDGAVTSIHAPAGLNYGM